MDVLYCGLAHDATTAEDNMPEARSTHAGALSVTSEGCVDHLTVSILIDIMIKKMINSLTVT